MQPFTNRIWIPSQQQWADFQQLTTQHQLYLAKAVSLNDFSNLDLLQALNNVLTDLGSNHLDLSQLTIIDRFAIFLQIVSKNMVNSFSVVTTCPKCEQQFTQTITASQQLSTLAKYGDQDFQLPITVDNIELTVDVPSIHTEYQIAEQLSKTATSKQQKADWWYMCLLFSYIQDISIDGVHLDLDTQSMEDREQICKKLPAKVLNQVTKQFISPINKTMDQVVLETLTCTNSECEHQQKLSPSLLTLTDLIKIYIIPSTGTLYRDIYDLCKHLSFSYESIMQMSPGEREVYKQMFKQDAQSKARKQQSAQFGDIEGLNDQVDWNNPRQTPQHLANSTPFDVNIS